MSWLDSEFRLGVRVRPLQAVSAGGRNALLCSCHRHRRSRVPLPLAVGPGYRAAARRHHFRQALREAQPSESGETPSGARPVPGRLPPASHWPGRPGPQAAVGGRQEDSINLTRNWRWLPIHWHHWRTGTVTLAIASPKPEPRRSGSRCQPCQWASLAVPQISQLEGNLPWHSGSSYFKFKLDSESLGSVGILECSFGHLLPQSGSRASNGKPQAAARKAQHASHSDCHSLSHCGSV